MERVAGGKAGERASILVVKDSVGHGKEFGLYSEESREPLEGLSRGEI